MGIFKTNCKYCPPLKQEDSISSTHRDWEMHPSWIAGMEALNAYNDWVSSVVMPIAFQWIEEHKPEVYATVSEELKDDVGVVIAAAFKLVKELPVYKDGLEKSAAYDAGMADGTFDHSKINPVWTRITKKVREETEEAKKREEAYAEYSSNFEPAKVVSLA
jgi:hypothetical protein